MSTTTINSKATDSNHDRKIVRSQINNKLDAMNETEPSAKKVRFNLTKINAMKSRPQLSSYMH